MPNRKSGGKRSRQRRAQTRLLKQLNEQLKTQLMSQPEPAAEGESTESIASIPPVGTKRPRITHDDGRQLHRRRKYGIPRLMDLVITPPETATSSKSAPEAIASTSTASCSAPEPVSSSCLTEKSIAMYEFDYLSAPPSEEQAVSMYLHRSVSPPPPSPTYSPLSPEFQGPSTKPPHVLDLTGESTRSIQFVKTKLYTGYLQQEPESQYYYAAVTVLLSHFYYVDVHCSLDEYKSDLYHETCLAYLVDGPSEPAPNTPPCQSHHSGTSRLMLPISIPFNFGCIFPCKTTPHKKPKAPAMTIHLWANRPLSYVLSLDVHTKRHLP